LEVSLIGALTLLVTAMSALCRSLPLNISETFWENWLC